MVLHQLKRSLFDRPDGIIKNILMLRMALIVISAGLLIAQKNTDLLEVRGNWPFVVLAMMMAWSLIAFKTARLQQANSLVRELIIDISWVLAIAYTTGGTSNPFIYYYLVITAIAAVTLTFKQAWMICALGIMLYTALLISDSQQHFAHFSTDYRVHLVAMWLNYLAGTIITCFFITNLMRLIRQQEFQLSAAREENLKNEQLIALATVAASTVHNLATPISTVKLIAEDILEQQSLPEDIKNDALLMKTQLERCFSTMKNLSNLAQQSEDLKPVSVSDIVESIKEHYSLQKIEQAPVIYDNACGKQKILSNELFYYALINLINNAIDSSNEHPTLAFNTHQQQLTITIENQSELNAEQILVCWGKPKTSNKETGLGIGSFLANSTIEKQGGTVGLEIIPVEDTTKTDVTIRVTVSFPIISNSI